MSSLGKEQTHGWLCSLCRSTLAGVAYEYPEQYPGQEVALRTICYIGNVILEAIEDLKRGPGLP